MGTNSSDLWAAALSTLNEEDRKSIVFEGQNNLEVLSELGQLVASAKENSIKKRWRFHRSSNGQTVILRDLFSKIVVWVDRFKEIGDTVVQYDPVHAALPWAGVRFLLQIAVGDINIFAFVVEGTEIVSRCISRYATFEQIYLNLRNGPSRAIRGLEEALIRLYARILYFLGKAKKYFEEDTLKRMGKSVVSSPSVFETLLRSIDNELSDVDRHASLVDAEHGNDISTTLVTLATDQREMHTRLCELLKSIDSPLCRMSSQLDSLEDQVNHSERIQKKAPPGSGQWLLQDPLYIGWYNQSASSLLWLHGKPGSGKSTLVSIVIEDMMEKFRAGQGSLPVYFYCRRSTAEIERSKPNAVLASILRQLSCYTPDAPLLTPVIDTYKSRGEGFTSNGLDLDDCRDLIIKLIENYGMTSIVVDALDECDPQWRQSLLDAFEQILKDSAGLVKIFVSSRNDQDIVYTLRDYPNFDISSDRNAADIETYVKIETQKLVKRGQLLRNSPAKEEMTKLIIERLSSKADGMFRWVSLQLVVLRTLKRDEDVRSRLGKLLKELEKLYLEVYSNLITDQDQIGRSIIDNALKWLLCARTELGASVFLSAVGANLDTDGDISKDSLLDLCNNLVIYDDSLDVFRFAHLSVREFLEHKQEFGELSCCSLAAECCLLQIIAFSNRADTEHLMSGRQLLRLCESPNCTESSSYKSLADGSPPDESFAGHAFNYWRDYCQQIPLEERSESTRFGNWVQWRCSHIESFGASEASLQLQSFLTSCSDCLSRSFLVATYCGFTDIVISCIIDLRLSEERKDQGLLLAAMTARHEVFDILFESMKPMRLTELQLLHAVESFDEDRLGSLLDKASGTIVTNRVFAAIAEDPNNWDDGKVVMLLDRYLGLSVEQGVLTTAFYKASLETFRQLVTRATSPVPMQYIIYHVLISANAYTEKMTILLNKLGESDLTPGLIASAIANSNERTIEMMLERATTCNITDNLMIAAIKRGDKFLTLMMNHGGKVTDALFDSMAAFCGEKEFLILLEQGYKPSINAKRLKLAAENYLYGSDVVNLLLDNADDSVPVMEITEVICHFARKRRDIEQLRHLVNRAKDISISQDMLWAATLNSNPGRFGRVQMLLEQSSEVQITEDMLIVAACDGNDGVDLVTIFLDRECEAEMSEYVLLAAVCNCPNGDEMTRFFLQHRKAANWAANWMGDVLTCAAQNLSPDLVLDILECSGNDVTAKILEAAAKTMAMN